MVKSKKQKGANKEKPIVQQQDQPLSDNKTNGKVRFEINSQQFFSVQFKGICNGCQNIKEIIQSLQIKINELKQKQSAGFELEQAVQEDYGVLVNQHSLHNYGGLDSKFENGQDMDTQNGKKKKQKNQKASDNINLQEQDNVQQNVDENQNIEAKVEKKKKKNKVKEELLQQDNQDHDKKLLQILPENGVSDVIKQTYKGKSKKRQRENDQFEQPQSIDVQPTESKKRKKRKQIINNEIEDRSISKDVNIKNDYNFTESQLIGNGKTEIAQKNQKKLKNDKKQKLIENKENQEFISQTQNNDVIHVDLQNEQSQPILENGDLKIQQPDQVNIQNVELYKNGQVRHFQRVQSEQWIDRKAAADNSYFGTFGESGWGHRAQQALGKVRGKDFRHEKTKKKRGTYRGGAIDSSQVMSFKYDSDDE